MMIEKVHAGRIERMRVAQRGDSGLRRHIVVALEGDFGSQIEYTPVGDFG